MCVVHVCVCVSVYMCVYMCLVHVCICVYYACDLLLGGWRLVTGTQWRCYQVMLPSVPSVVNSRPPKDVPDVAVSGTVAGNHDIM